MISDRKDFKMAFIDNYKTGQAYRVLVDQDENEQNVYDVLSFWTSASDVTFTNGTNLEEVSDFSYAEAVLPANQEEITISGSNISMDGLLDIYVEDEFCHRTPKSVVRDAPGSVTLTFDPINEPMTIRVTCKNYSNVNGT